ncbi:hypothetical protein NQZ68_007509 [Dissostichus eleginoides]|nr:hypothetical protein NQZ68_007509 [Dissostichus eleginoides]
MTLMDNDKVRVRTGGDVTVMLFILRGPSAAIYKHYAARQAALSAGGGGRNQRPFHLAEKTKLGPYARPRGL